MYCLESAQQMPALPEEIEEALAENIQINNSWGPKQFITENGKLTKVEFKKCTSIFDDQNRFNPQYDENETIIVDADKVILSIGQSIEHNELLKGLNIEVNRNNTIKADSFTYQTNEKDIFVGGDVYTGPRFAIDAIAAGKEGAISIHRSVHEGQSLVLGRDRRNYIALDKSNLRIEGYDNTPRQRVLHDDKNHKSFKDNRLTFTEEQVKKETARCLGCGAVQVDQYMCIGCGQCTTKCMFDAITLERRYNEFAPVFEQLPIEVAKYAVKRSANIAVNALNPNKDN
ncbi:MAG: FAD-dependent oxidoreductase, partial [Erysipelotrichaceae bacterium]